MGEARVKACVVALKCLEDFGQIGFLWTLQFLSFPSFIYLFINLFLDTWTLLLRALGLVKPIGTKKSIKKKKSTQKTKSLLRLSREMRHTEKLPSKIV